MATLSKVSASNEVAVDDERRYFAKELAADTDLDDLIHSWRRLESLALKRLAVRLIRALGEDRPGEAELDHRRGAQTIS